MKRSLWFVILSLVLALTASTTHADTLQFLGTGGNTVGSVYAYPYYFSIDGSHISVAMMCLSYDNEIVSGESWQAVKESLVGLDSRYDEAAWLLQDATDHPANAGNDNLAAWGLFAADVPVTAGSEGQLALAEDGAGGVDLFRFVVYAPAALPEIQNGAGGSPVPQTFIGIVQTPVPEPGSLLLLGTGLMVVGWVGRRGVRVLVHGS